MAQFIVDSEVIASKSAQAKAHVASITAEVNGMTASLQDLQSSWTGSASTNFQGVLDKWRATQRQVWKSLSPRLTKRFHVPVLTTPIPNSRTLRCLWGNIISEFCNFNSINRYK